MSWSGALLCVTYPQTSGASGSLVSRLTRLTLMELIKDQLLKGNDQVRVLNLFFFLLFPTHSNSFGSGEASVSRLASRSTWAGSSSAAILSSRSLREKTGTPVCSQYYSLQICAETLKFVSDLLTAGPSFPGGPEFPGLPGRPCGIRSRSGCDLLDVILKTLAQ